jgi:hypothetical protein
MKLDELKLLTRKDLQRLAKEFGIKANMTSAKIIQQISDHFQNQTALTENDLLKPEQDECNDELHTCRDVNANLTDHAGTTFSSNATVDEISVENDVENISSENNTYETNDIHNNCDLNQSVTLDCHAGSVSFEVMVQSQVNYNELGDVDQSIADEEQILDLADSKEQNRDTCDSTTYLNLASTDIVTKGFTPGTPHLHSKATKTSILREALSAKKLIREEKVFFYIFIPFFKTVISVLLRCADRHILKTTCYHH